MPFSADRYRDAAVLHPDNLGHVRGTRFRSDYISRDNRALVDGRLRRIIVDLHSISGA
jgi:hypothetical protein